jgi:hypothetical protein
MGPGLDVLCHEYIQPISEKLTFMIRYFGLLPVSPGREYRYAKKYQDHTRLFCVSWKVKSLIDVNRLTGLRKQ